MHGKVRNIYKILVGKHELKRSFGRPWYRWEDDIKIDVREKPEKLWNRFTFRRTETSDGLL
jgi:hypothetical protein